MSLNQSKKLLWPVFALLLLAACTQLESFHEDDSLSKDGVSVSMDVIQPIINHISSGERIWSVAKKSIPANTVLKYGPYGFYDPDNEDCGTVQSPDYEAWLINFSGDARSNNSAEGAFCVFVNISTGEYKTAPIYGQICGIEWDDSIYKIADEAPVIENKEDTGEIATISEEARAAVSKHYAVIISGGADLQNNYSRYWNDCQYIYKRLTQTLGYDKSHIYCLVADGKDPAHDMVYDFLINPYTGKILDICTTTSPLDFDGDGVDDIQYSATKQNISQVFNQLKSKASSIEHLLVFVTDHGNKGGKICLWNEQQMTPEELNTELRKLPNVKMDIVMGQCYSGGYVPYLGVSTNRTVATACSATETSNAEDIFTYDSFLHAWTDAFNPTNKTAVDKNRDNMLSLKEAFDYAKAHDSAAIRNEEHPQFATSPNYYGYLHDLQGKYYEPVITGSDNLQGDNQYTYTISGLPSSVSVRWSCSSELRIINQTSSTVTVQSTIPSNQYVAAGARIFAHATIDGEDIVIEKYIFSIWRSGWFSNQNKIYYTADGDYTVETGYGAYDYQWGSSNSSWTIFPPSGSPRVRITAQNPGTATVYVAFKNPFGETVAVGQEIRLNY